MNTELAHHGILGMKWGVRRTPEELGHGPKGSHNPFSRSEKKETTVTVKTNIPTKKKKVGKLTDEELKKRIDRLNMEEQYSNLLARRKERETGPIKKMMSKALTNLGDRVLGVAIDKFVDKLKGGSFDPSEWANTDPSDMDLDTAKKMSQWYSFGETIRKKREDAPPKEHPKPENRTSDSIIDEYMDRTGKEASSDSIMDEYLKRKKKLGG